MTDIPQTEQELPPIDPAQIKQVMSQIEAEHYERTGRSMPSNREVEDFLSKVENTHQKVKDIIDGKIDLDEFDKEEIYAAKMERTKVEILARE